MLNQKFQNERALLTLINATVSHELRNPLNSIVGQILMMVNLFDDIQNIIDLLKTKEQLSKSGVVNLT